MKTTNRMMIFKQLISGEDVYVCELKPGKTFTFHDIEKFVNSSMVSIRVFKADGTKILSC